MRRLNVLTWHTHGSYLYYLTQVPHEFYVLGGCSVHTGTLARIDSSISRSDQPPST